MATVEADGTITLLGRGSNCINTGGEKVLPEEVEEALKQHPGVEDALVFGVPDERFGNRVVGVASLVSGATASAEEVIGDAKRRLSSYKLPKQLVIVERVPRAPNGKADYPTAKKLFEAAGGLGGEAKPASPRRRRCTIRSAQRGQRFVHDLGVEPDVIVLAHVRAAHDPVCIQ